MTRERARSSTWAARGSRRRTEAGRRRERPAARGARHARRRPASTRGPRGPTPRPGRGQPCINSSASLSASPPRKSPRLATCWRRRSPRARRSRLSAPRRDGGRRRRSFCRLFFGVGPDRVAPRRGRRPAHFKNLPLSKRTQPWRPPWARLSWPWTSRQRPTACGSAAAALPPRRFGCRRGLARRPPTAAGAA